MLKPTSITMTTIKIYQNSERLKNMVIIFSVLIIILIYFIFNSLYNYFCGNYIDNYIYLKLLAIFLELSILIIIFILLIRLLIIIRMKKPFLVFSEEKIVSNGLISKSELYWDEVDYRTNSSLNGIYFIVLKLRSDSKFKTESSFFRKILNNYNLNRVGGEVAFASVFLMDNFENVNELISLKTHKKFI